MKEAISITVGNMSHYFNPDLDDFVQDPCECSHSLLPEAERVKAERHYRGDIECIEINIYSDDDIYTELF